MVAAALGGSAQHGDAPRPNLARAGDLVTPPHPDVASHIQRGVEQPLRYKINTSSMSPDMSPALLWGRRMWVVIGVVIVLIGLVYA